jgi:alpha-amylase/alpha-mannosidase (GH57 family)
LHNFLQRPATIITIEGIMAKSRTSTKSAKSAATEAPRFVCIHGHFYQPPRENPWLETVEAQESAAPYHDWNDRITAECYAPNGASRITNKQNEIIRIMNNYARMSFNFGPTLLSWLEDKAPRTYRMIVDADKFSAQRYSGHGSAVAQAYNHMIMPLASRRDAITQIRWGIADFESRFGHRPEGMWLAETAVNRSVLDLMAQEGIKFTILAPAQCARVRKIATESSSLPLKSSTSPSDPLLSLSELSSPPPEPSLSSPEPSLSSPGSSLLSSRSAAEGSASPSSEAQTETQTEIPWSQTPNANVDPTHPYLINLDEGRTIAVFFYDGPSSRAIAFEGLLNSGENFGSRLLAGFHPTSPGDPEVAQISHVATDGESYGHHHKHGEMALSYAMHWIEEGKQAKLTNYGEFLERFPPKWEAEVAEDTSWSCAHGVERWRSNCGCNGGKPGWNQEWRAPLRESLDYLRDTTASLAEQLATGLLKDLWAARDAYIHVVLDRSPASIIRFFADHAARHLSEAERTTALELMELERHAQLMYTSCGWFFDEVSGIETIQIIAYAGRVLQLAAKLFGEHGAALEPKFLEILARAKSNVPEMGDGAEVYRRYVTGMRIGLEQVGAHYAISSIFRNYPEHGELFCFDVHRESQEIFNSGRGRVALGRALVYSRITEENEEICFAVLHLGDQNLSAAVRAYNSLDKAEVEAFATFSTDISTAIRRANLPEVIRLIDRFFGQGEAPGQSQTAYSLTSLFADEQHRIISTILNQTLSDVEESLRKIYEDHASLMHFLTESGMTAPPALATAARFAINASLRRAIESDQFDPDNIELLLSRAVSDQIPLDAPLLGYTTGQRMKRAMISLEAAAAGDIAAAGALSTALVVAETIHKMPFEVNIWQAQNIWNDLLRRSDTNYWTDEWKEDFKKLGEIMNIKVDQLVIEEGVSVF